MKKTKLLKLKRTIKEGWTSFGRNKWLSSAAVLVSTFSLYTIGITLFFGLAVHTLTTNIEKNVSISAYLRSDISNEKIEEIKKEIEKQGIVASVDYVSNQQAYEKFSNDFKDDPVIKEALDEIGMNPLLASLIVKAKSTEQYEELAKYLNDSFEDEFDSVNYGKNKNVIDRLQKVVIFVRKGGIAIGVVFILIAILVNFNAIRLSLYARKKEFEIMRLVGASNLYIKMPSIFEGIFYGFLASLIAMILIALSVYGMLPLLKGLIPQEEIFAFSLNNLAIVFGVVSVSGLLVGFLSSYIAIRRYLKI